MNIEDRIAEIEGYIIDLRRRFHQNPELSWEEYETSKIISEELDKMKIPYKKECGTAVIATIKGGKPGKALGIRADIDALPIKEETGLEYASKKEGVMHACGHDAHTAILLGTARILNDIKDELVGDVRLVFQPAEEFIQDSGAKYLSQLDSILTLDRIIGLHIWANIDSGKAALREGPIMASADTFDIYIEGKSGHGAQPDQAIDPIVAGSMAVNALQTIVSRENNPLDSQVISITASNSGSSKNIIPQAAHLEGTTRAFNNNVRDNFESQIRRILEGIATITRTKIKLEYHNGTPATINEPESTKLGINIAKEVFKDGFIGDFPLQMGGEDFAKYLVNIPGCFMFLGGAGKAGHFSQHNKSFQIDEAALKLGVEYFVRYALAYLK